MKTAMQQLLERIEATINNDPANDIGIGQAIGLKLVKASIENEWLELEKQQIIEAYTKGVKDFVRWEPEIHGNQHPTAEEYFNKTFKSDE